MWKFENVKMWKWRNGEMGED